MTQFSTSWTSADEQAGLSWHSRVVLVSPPVHCLDHGSSSMSALERDSRHGCGTAADHAHRFKKKTSPQQMQDTLIPEQSYWKLAREQYFPCRWKRYVVWAGGFASYAKLAAHGSIYRPLCSEREGHDDFSPHAH